MDVSAKCAHCREEIGEPPVEWKGKLYCCEACAFEASKKLGCFCGSQDSVETSLRYSKKPAQKGG